MDELPVTLRVVVLGESAAVVMRGEHGMAETLTADELIELAERCWAARAELLAAVERAAAERKRLRLRAEKRVRATAC